MDIISKGLAWHTIGNLIVMDGPCLLGHWVKKGEDNTSDFRPTEFASFL